MNTVRLIALLLGILHLTGCSFSDDSVQELQNGDIIFQTSKSSQSKAIQLATGSRYSHVGIVYRKGDDFFVFEAVQPVKTTPLDKWIQQGENRHFVVKRLRNAEKLLTADVLQKMKLAGSRFEGKNYDLYFEWSDQRIYCSELVWKIYKEAAGVELGELEFLKSFNIKHPSVAQKLRERYGRNIPLNERVISPESIYQSEKLVTVIEN